MDLGVIVMACIRDRVSRSSPLASVRGHFADIQQIRNTNNET